MQTRSRLPKQILNCFIVNRHCFLVSNSKGGKKVLKKKRKLKNLKDTTELCVETLQDFACPKIIKAASLCLDIGCQIDNTSVNFLLKCMEAEF